MITRYNTGKLFYKLLSKENTTGSVDFSNPIHITNESPSINYNSGALVVDGGVGIAGDIFTNGNLTIGDNIYCDNIYHKTANPLRIHGKIELTDTTPATSTDGALILNGGLYCKSNIYTDGKITCMTAPVNDYDVIRKIDVPDISIITQNAQINEAEYYINFDSTVMEAMLPFSDIEVRMHKSLGKINIQIAGYISLNFSAIGLATKIKLKNTSTSNIIFPEFRPVINCVMPLILHSVDGINSLICNIVITVDGEIYIYLGTTSFEKIYVTLGQISFNYII